jgi:uncharacterized membrane protein YeaQ/YmgE (transglycosylase-associated protein family)
MSILWIILIGFLAGVIAKLIHPGPNEPSGFILTTLLGIGGAFVATYLGQAIGWYRADQGAGLVGATVGALIVLFVWGMFVPPPASSIRRRGCNAEAARCFGKTFASLPVLMLEVVRHVAAILREFSHDLLVQPDVHGCRIVRVAGIMQFLSQLLARGQAAVQVEDFHQVNDRSAPIEFFLLLRCEPAQHLSHVDVRRA